MSNGSPHRSGPAREPAPAGRCTRRASLAMGAVLLAPRGWAQGQPQPARDLGWAQLAPPGYRAQPVLDRLGVNDLEDRDARAEAILAEVRRAWDKAPPITPMPQGLVRLTGFAVMLSEGDEPVTRALLVPYYGACIHSPPPPANQAVLLTLAQPLPRRMYQFPIQVTGALLHRPSATQYGKVLYAMRDAHWQPHPWPRQPLPVYRLP